MRDPETYGKLAEDMGKASCVVTTTGPLEGPKETRWAKSGGPGWGQIVGWPPSRLAWYLDTAGGRHGIRPKLGHRGRPGRLTIGTGVRSLEQLGSEGQRCFCHNDAGLGNFIAGEDGRMRLIDWEYAGMNDPLFDLATLLVGHLHGARSEAALVDAYVAQGGEVDPVRLDAMKFMYELREASWSLLHYTLVGGSGPLAPAFRDAADRFFAAARRRL